MSKRSDPDILKRSLEQAGGGRRPALGMPALQIPEASPIERPPRRSRGEGPREPRPDREGRKGIVIYVSTRTHTALRKRALNQGVTLKDLCKEAVLDILTRKGR